MIPLLVQNDRGAKELADNSEAKCGFQRNMCMIIQFFS